METLRSFRASLALLAILTTGLANAAQDDRFGDVRVLRPERGPKDARLEGAVTLDGYFPWTPYADTEAWTERAERVRRQILVAAGLWPMPPKTPLEPVVSDTIDRGD